MVGADKTTELLRPPLFALPCLDDFDFNALKSSVTRKNRQISIKVAQKLFHLKNYRF